MGAIGIETTLDSTLTAVCLLELAVADRQAKVVIDRATAMQNRGSLVVAAMLTRKMEIAQ
jgi:hypothetical protein